MEETSIIKTEAVLASNEDEVVEVIFDIDVDPKLEEDIKKHICKSCDEKCNGSCAEALLDNGYDQNALLKLEHDLFIEIGDFKCKGLPITIDYLEGLYNRVKGLI